MSPFAPGAIERLLAEIASPDAHFIRPLSSEVLRALVEHVRREERAAILRLVERELCNPSGCIDLHLHPTCAQSMLIHSAIQERETKT